MCGIILCYSVAKIDGSVGKLQLSNIQPEMIQENSPVSMDTIIVPFGSSKINCTV